MHGKTRVFLVVIICLGLCILMPPLLWAMEEAQQDALEQNRAETQQDVINTPHPAHPPPSFDDDLKQAESGEANAQYVLGRRYYYGDGVIQDRKKAVAWQTRAADQGHAAAQYVLGLLYLAGEGVDQDSQHAVVWISRSAELGLAEAQYALGMMYQNGEEVPRDSQKARELFVKAARQGNQGARKQLAANKGQGQE